MPDQTTPVLSLRQTQKTFALQTTQRNSILVYKFHSLLTQTRLFVLVYSPTIYATSYVDSVAELFPAANWLEREVAELSGVVFTGKKDLRNLMLPYGDSSHPLQKSYPTIGLKEVVYSPVKDTLVQNPVSVQI